MRSSLLAGKSGTGLSRSVWIWSFLFLIFMGLMGYTLYQSRQQSSDGERLTQLLAELKLTAQRMTTYGLESARGQPQAFLRLNQLKREFGESVLKLNGGGENFPEIQKEFEPDVQLINELWRRYGEDIEQILEGRDRVSTAIEAIDRVEGALPALKSSSAKVVEVLRSGGAPSGQVYFASRQLVMVERIENSLIRILSGDIDAVSSADQFGDDVSELSSALDAMLRGGADSPVKRVSGIAARKALADVADAFGSTADNAGAIVAASPVLFQVAEAANKLDGQGSRLFEALERLEAALIEYYKQADLGAKASLLFAALAFLSFLMVVFSVYQGTRKQLIATQETNKRNQMAILQLLDEMSTLAEGDLTIEASVTEDITGAIADSMNYAIDAMRQLVRTIMDSSGQVEETARLSQNTVTELASSNREQAKQITSVSKAVEDLNRSIGKVSQYAEDSADVAELAVEIAHKGANTVRGTIEGMDTIREKIQDTAKRIKRLGESSQEIGDIVGLITDIADQTNILALNAAIQASAAGEDGRGFAVVADEVQRLAERSSNASKQIEALVKTIQADTNEAVHSMEQSTSNVVTGANLAEEAGKALGEIETVSHSMAGLITDISGEAREQASISAVVAETMTSIQRITGQTVASSNDTATAVGELVEQSMILKQSALGFSLPEDEADSALDVEVDEFSVAPEDTEKAVDSA